MLYNSGSAVLTIFPIGVSLSATGSTTRHFEISIEAPGLETIGDTFPQLSEETKGWLFKKNLKKASWRLKGSEGEYDILYQIGDNHYSKDIIITNAKKYKQPENPVNDGIVQSIRIDNEPIRVLGMSWFWAYFLFALVFNSLLRKLLKVH